MDTNETRITSWQWALSGIVIVVLIALGIYLFTRDGGETVVPTPTVTNTPSTNLTEVNRLVVTDQFPGNVVFITTVQLAKPGFVTITKDVAGKAGMVIGTQSFDKGINTGKVTLTEKTMDGKTYHALLYYTEAKDKVLLEKTFKARMDLPEDKG